MHPKVELVMCWLGFGLAFLGLGLTFSRPRPNSLALAWLQLGLAQAMASCQSLTSCFNYQIRQVNFKLYYFYISIIVKNVK
jgi:hypothetical protein